MYDGKKIEAWRVRRGLKQGELATMCNSSQKHISEIENGVVRNPGLVLLGSIAEALQVKINDLLCDEYAEQSATRPMHHEPPPTQVQLEREFIMKHLQDISKRLESIERQVAQKNYCPLRDIDLSGLKETLERLKNDMESEG